MGDGTSIRIYSSSVVVGEVSGTGDNIGGLVGFDLSARIVSSSVVVGELSGNSNVGGLTGNFGSSSQLAYSYVVSGSNTNMPKLELEAGLAMLLIGIVILVASLMATMAKPKTSK